MLRWFVLLQLCFQLHPCAVELLNAGADMHAVQHREAQPLGVWSNHLSLWLSEMQQMVCWLCLCFDVSSSNPYVILCVVQHVWT